MPTNHAFVETLRSTYIMHPTANSGTTYILLVRSRFKCCKSHSLRIGASELYIMSRRRVHHRIHFLLANCVFLTEWNWVGWSLSYSSCSREWLCHPGRGVDRKLERSECGYRRFRCNQDRFWRQGNVEVAGEGGRLDLHYKLSRLL